MKTFSRSATHALVLGALLVLLLASGPAGAQECVPFLTYVDLATGGMIENPAQGLDVLSIEPLPSPTCPGPWYSALIQVTLPPQCSCAVVWVEYVGESDGWTVNIGDSVTNNGFGGDAGSSPAGQNAEVQVLDDVLTVYNAADNPEDVESLLTQHLRLRDGTLKFLVCDQYVSVGQPFASLATPDLERLFFLDPQTAENRTFYVGLNRVVGGTSRSGCGARRALTILQ